MPKHLSTAARWRAHCIHAAPAGGALAVVLVVALAAIVGPGADGEARAAGSGRAPAVAPGEPVDAPTTADAAVEVAPGDEMTQAVELDEAADDGVIVEIDAPVDSAGAATAAAPTAPPVPARVEHPALSAVLDPLVLGGPAGSVGVSISAPDGTPVYAYNAHVPLIPASTEKSVVGAAALRRLGPDHRYRTEVLATGQVDGNGVLDGALVLVGSGDPSLGTPVYGRVVPDRPRTRLEGLADQIVAAGVTEVRGGVLGDPTVLADQPMGPGWVAAHITNGYSARVSGLTVDAGRRMVPVRGGYGSVPVDDPAARAADALRNLLTQRGVEVSGPVGTSRTRIPRGAQAIAAVRSAPLATLVSHTIQTSDNHMADGIFRSLGAVDGDPTWAGSAAATRDALADLPLRWQGVDIVDGSGLSRRNRITPDFLADLSAAMGTSELRETWDAAMAVTGERGTLRNRMVGSPAQGRVLAKTGTLSGVRSLAGSVVGPDGSRYHFAIIGNELSGTGTWALLELQERIAVALVHDLSRCPQPGGIVDLLDCAA
jgi:serine-type D-Ala-D-Ala carboxypeptidase/endopeptidase (penicillin-binding protein 4)